MSRAILVFLTFLLSVTFLMTPRGSTWTPIWFSDKELHVEDYFYYLWEHVIMIVLLHIIHVDSKKYLSFFRYMFWFQVADAIDFMATYNAIWFRIGVIPVSINTLGCLTGFIFLAHNKLTKP
jgi:hypothetical protein